MLDHLINLAKDTSPEKRSELVEHVTRLYQQRSETERQDEIKVYNGVLDGIYNSLKPSDRQLVSDRLATVKSTSASLVGKMARDELPIARAILEQSQSLSQEMMVDIAETMGQEHLLALSKREYLSANVTKVLLSRGNKEVHQAVASNLGAEIGETDFERIVREFPTQLGDRIRHLRKSNQELIEDLFRDDKQAASGEPLQKKPTRMDAKGWLAGIRLKRATLGQAISALAQEKNLLEVVRLLSVFSGLELKYVHELMIRYDATGVASICRSVGINDTEYAAVCKARCKHLRFPESTGTKWVTNYHMLDQTDARRLVSLMKIKLNARKESPKEAA
ncbi:hypothetical protein GCM10011316_38810 [Roseibium aquae]|uniref:DUF2336 domain-containing protein n=1 Tax=Roseibium aquae TaxID=1323746 RepID=A0A916X2M6_9HYPH|nr:DUF2336 domain-containing protein [Roseibium aquae]GGB63176.1 hypothetical protein GCM10011316_38810 [Roseibium aquae]